MNNSVNEWISTDEELPDDGQRVEYKPSLLERSTQAIFSAGKPRESGRFMLDEPYSRSSGHLVRDCFGVQPGYWRPLEAPLTLESLLARIKTLEGDKNDLQAHLKRLEERLGTIIHSVIEGILNGDKLSQWIPVSDPRTNSLDENTLVEVRDEEGKIHIPAVMCGHDMWHVLSKDCFVFPGATDDVRVPFGESCRNINIENTFWRKILD